MPWITKEEITKRILDDIVSKGQTPSFEMLQERLSKHTVKYVKACCRRESCSCAAFGTGWRMEPDPVPLYFVFDQPEKYRGPYRFGT